MSNDSTSDNRSKPRGKRPMYFSCASVKDSQLIGEMIQTSDKDEAIKSFKAKNKVAPSYIEGPIYRVMGTGAAEASDSRATVSIKAKDIVHTEARWEAVFKGWTVIAHGIKAFGDYSDNDLVYLFITDPVDPKLVESKETPKPRFGAHQPVIKRDLLENAKPL